MEINEAQDLQFRLMELATFNEFDGHQIIADLKDNPNLWLGVVLGDIGGRNLIQLRDISKGEWNVDTLYILCQKEKAKELKRLASSWNANDICWVKSVQSALGDWTEESKELKVLSLWWD